jgi:hypothetical protein
MQNPVFGRAIRALADGAPRRKALCAVPLSRKTISGTAVRGIHVLLLPGVVGKVTGACAVAAPLTTGERACDIAAADIRWRHIDIAFDVFGSNRLPSKCHKPS